MKKSSEKKALVLVDIQNDFCPGGSLAVPDGDAVVALANTLQAHFDLIVATKDWHPANHVSFAANHPGHQVGDTITVNGEPQILWPNHCMQHSRGAEFHPSLHTEQIQKIIYKGSNKNRDCYSGFFTDATGITCELADYLHSQNIRELYIMGLATDYCVKHSCLDAVRLGFSVHLIEDACRGVELQPGDVTRAISEMQAAGVQITNASILL